MSDDRIFIRFKGKTLGPLTDQKVRDLVRRGQITRMHELSSDGLSWQRAEDFGDFFQGRGNPVKQAPAADVTQSSASLLIRPNDPANDSASRPIPGQIADDGVEWYAHVNGQNHGPLRRQQITDWVQAGQVTSETLVWRAGYDDWRPVVDCMSELFNPKLRQAGTPSVRIQEGGQGDSNGDISIGGHDGSAVPSELMEGFIDQRPWVLTVSIFFIVWASLSAIYFITMMVVGGEVNGIRARQTGAVVGGLVGLLGSGLQIAGGILLLNYASALLRFSKQPDVRRLREASRKLYVFWKYCAIVMLVVLILIVGFAVLAIVMATAATDAVT